MSIFKETFSDFVKKQLKKRGNLVASGAGRTETDGSVNFKFNDDRSDEFFQYQSKQCVIRLSSGVNIDDETAWEDDDITTGSDLAEDWVLQGGIQRGGTNRGGIGSAGAYGSTDIKSDASDGYGIVPMPGIVDATIATKSAYGSLRTAKVNFVCHNQRQLEILETLYMRPGYTLLLEWGWVPYFDESNNIQHTFDYIDDFFNDKTTTLDLEQTIIEKKQESGGNYDAIIGYIKNFEYNLRPDGGFNCKTEIIAKGELLESLKDKEARAPAFTENVTQTYSPYTLILLDKIRQFSIHYADAQNTTWQNPFKGYAWSNAFEWGTTERKRVNLFSNDLAADLDLKDRDTDGEEFGDNADQAGNATFGYVIPKGEEEKGWDVGNSFQAIRAETTYIRWDALAYLLNKYIVPKDEHGDMLFQIQTNQLTDKGKKIEPLLYTDCTPQFLKDKVKKLKRKTWQGDDKEDEIEDFLVSWEHVDISVNPQICRLPHTMVDIKDNLGGDSKYKETWKAHEPLAELLSRTSPHKPKPDTGNDSPYKASNQIGRIYLGVEYLIATFKQEYYTDVGGLNPDYTLFKFLKKVWDDVSGCTNGHHSFDIHVDNSPSGTTVRIVDFVVDAEEIDLDEVYELPIQSLDSTARNINYNTALPNSVATTIAVAAQDSDSIDNLDKVSFAAINKGIKDRFGNKITQNDNPTQTEQERWADEFDGKVKELENIYYQKSGDKVKEYGQCIKFLLEKDEKGNEYSDEEAFADFSAARGALAAVQRSVDYFYAHYASTNKDKNYYKGQPVKDVSPRLSAVIPLRFNVELDGISGLIIGNVFKLPKNRLPIGYKEDDIHFIVMKEEQKIKGHDWTTSIRGNLILLAKEAEIQKRNKDWVSSWNNLPESKTLLVYKDEDEVRAEEAAKDNKNPWHNWIDDVPWSACFVSTMAKRALSDFPVDPYHAGYSKMILDGVSTNWRALDPLTTPLKKGDIIVRNRSNANVLETQSWYHRDKWSMTRKSHGDIVVDIAPGSSTVTIIGGNLSDTVKKETLETFGGSTKWASGNSKGTAAYIPAQVYSWGSTTAMKAYGLKVGINLYWEGDVSFNFEGKNVTRQIKVHDLTAFKYASKYWVILRSDDETANRIVKEANWALNFWGGANEKDTSAKIETELYSYYRAAGKKPPKPPSLSATWSTEDTIKSRTDGTYVEPVEASDEFSNITQGTSYTAAKTDAEKKAEELKRQLQNQRRSSTSNYNFTCFVKGTKVTMADKTEKNIENIKEGDKILSYNISTKEFGIDKVLPLPKTLGNYQKIIATYEDGTKNEFSPAHPFYIEGKGWSSYNLNDELITGKKEGAPTWSSMKLKQLEIGDYCINNKGEKLKITSLEETNEYVDMYNLEHLSNNKTWFANGILVKE